MSYDYSKLAATASKLLTKYGKNIDLKRVTGGGVNPVTGQVTAGTSAILKTTGIFRAYPDSVIDGTRILKSDREVIIDGTIEPKLTDKLIVGGEEWTIKNVVAQKPANLALVYFVQACR